VRIVIGTGGTAGHIFPALATAIRLRDGYGADVVFAGTASGQEAALVPAAGFPFESIDAVPFHRKLSLHTVLAPVTALRAAREARRLIRGADAVLGMGGYVSVPVSLAARRERVPLVVHEQNATMGLANRLAARWATVVALSFREAGSHLPRRARATVVGNPVRQAIVEAAGRRQEMSAEARRELGLEQGRLTILVSGGSQGAVRLNNAALELSRLLHDREDLQVLLVSGPKNHDSVLERLPSPGRLLLKVVPFIERIELAYAASDLAIARAGATTVAELSVSGVPSILIPYPYATANHQEANARALERAGGAAVLLDEQTSGQALARLLETLLEWPDRLPSMARAAREHGRPDAAESLARLVASVASSGRR
jgi:UDP-N-acetylglucosamine--N-acetylmuramyl-(pentapeptide) pyrophosphoryl-undecaprenol N-acetylglucosamine transferase